MIWKKIIYIMGVVVHLSCATQPMSASLWQRLCSPFARSVETIKQRPVVALAAVVGTTAVFGGLYWWKKFKIRQRNIEEIERVLNSSYVLDQSAQLYNRFELCERAGAIFRTSLYGHLTASEINQWIINFRSIYTAKTINDLNQSKTRLYQFLKSIRNRW